MILLFLQKVLKPKYITAVPSEADNPDLATEGGVDGLSP